MASRLGDVLYWLGAIIASLIALLGFWALLNRAQGSHAFGIPLFIAAAGFWLVGRACRYILAGR